MQLGFVLAVGRVGHRDRQHRLTGFVHPAQGQAVVGYRPADRLTLAGQHRQTLGGPAEGATGRRAIIAEVVVETAGDHHLGARGVAGSAGDPLGQAVLVEQALGRQRRRIAVTVRRGRDVIGGARQTVVLQISIMTIGSPRPG